MHDVATDIQERLLRVDMEIHEILRELRAQETASVSVDELAARMEKDIISDEDPGDVVRKMREKDYDL